MSLKKPPLAQPPNSATSTTLVAAASSPMAPTASGTSTSPSSLPRVIHQLTKNLDAMTGCYAADANATQSSSSLQPNSSALSDEIRGKLHALFAQIEQQFELLYAQNVHLQRQLLSAAAAAAAAAASQTPAPFTPPSPSQAATVSANNNNSHRLSQCRVETPPSKLVSDLIVPSSQQQQQHATSSTSASASSSLSGSGTNSNNSSTLSSPKSATNMVDLVASVANNDKTIVSSAAAAAVIGQQQQDKQRTLAPASAPPPPPHHPHPSFTSTSPTPIAASASAATETVASPAATATAQTLTSTNNAMVRSSSTSQSLASTLTSQAAAHARSALQSSKTRINNISFAKFRRPINAQGSTVTKELANIMQSIKNTSSHIVNNNNNNSGAGGVGGGVGASGCVASSSANAIAGHGSLHSARLAHTLHGHRDGIWDVNCVPIADHLLHGAHTGAQPNELNLLIGTASADTTARLWYLNAHGYSGTASELHQHTTAFCVQEYCGHTGSVNSIRFHPRFFTDATNLIATGSGDTQAHIWQCVLSPLSDSLESTSDLLLNYNACYSYATAASNASDSAGVSSSSSSTSAAALVANPSLIRSPIKRYETHTDACIAAEWFPDGGEMLCTGSWDRTAHVLNVETGRVLCTMQHDDYLTNVSIHATRKLVLTSSKDTTFKVWDFRDPICSVNVYQGHQRSVNSAIFVGDDKIATSSDDHTVKLWDLRVMRSPVTTINVNSGVNRLCVVQPVGSDQPLLALPLDNRDIKIYTLSGERLLRLPRAERSSASAGGGGGGGAPHRRLVTSLASCGNMLLSASFDKLVACWSLDYTSPGSSCALPSASAAATATASANAASSSFTSERTTSALTQKSSSSTSSSSSSHTPTAVSHTTSQNNSMSRDKEAEQVASTTTTSLAVGADHLATPHNHRLSALMSAGASCSPSLQHQQQQQQHAQTQVNGGVGSVTRIITSGSAPCSINAALGATQVPHSPTNPLMQHQQQQQQQQQQSNQQQQQSTTKPTKVTGIALAKLAERIKI